MLTLSDALREELESADLQIIWKVRIVYAADPLIEKNFVSGGGELFGYDPSVATVSIEGVSLNPVTREVAVTADAEVVFVDDGSLRGYNFDKLLGAVVTISIGTPNILESEFAKIYRGLCAEAVTGGGSIRLSLSNKLDFKEPLLSRVYCVHPYTLLEILLQRKYPDFEMPAVPASTAHWLTSMPLRGDGPWTEESDVNAMDMSDPIEWAVSDVLLVIGGCLRRGIEDATPSYVPYDMGTPAAKFLGPSDYYPETLEHLGSALYHYTAFETDLNSTLQSPITLEDYRLANKYTGKKLSSIVLGMKEGSGVRGGPGDTFRWNSAIVRNTCPAKSSNTYISGILDVRYIFTTSASYSGFCYSKCSWAGLGQYTFDVGHGSTGMVDEYGPLFLLSSKQFGFEVARAGDVSQHIYSSVGGGAYPAGWDVSETQIADPTVLLNELTMSQPHALRWGIPIAATHSAQYGTAVQENRFFDRAFDITIVDEVNKRLLSRFKDGVIGLRVTLTPKHVDLEVGDVVSITVPEIATPREPGGLVAGVTTWEVVERSVRLEEAPPGISVTLVELDSTARREDDPQGYITGDSKDFLYGKDGAYKSQLEGGYYGNRYWPLAT